MSKPFSGSMVLQPLESVSSQSQITNLYVSTSWETVCPPPRGLPRTPVVRSASSSSMGKPILSWQFVAPWGSAADRAASTASVKKASWRSLTPSALLSKRNAQADLSHQRRGPPEPDCRASAGRDHLLGVAPRLLL